MYTGFSTIHSFRLPVGVLQPVPRDKGGNCCNAPSNTRVQISVWILVFNYFVCISISGVARSYHDSKKKHPTVFHRGCIILHWMDVNTFVKNQLPIDTWVYFSTLNSILLLYISIFITVPQCWLQYLCAELWNHEVWVFWLCYPFTRLFRVPWNSQWIWESAFPFLKSDRILIGITLNLQVTLVGPASLTILSSYPRIQMSFHLFRSYLISFSNVFLTFNVEILHLIGYIYS